MVNEEKISIDQYGRKSWNVEKYAEEAKKGNKKNPENDQIQKASLIHDNKSSSYLAHRNDILDLLLSAVRTHNLINPLATNTSFGKDKRFGFFCPLCDLSFRDNLALIDHLNSPQHLAKAKSLMKSAGSDSDMPELDNGIRRATKEEVISMIEQLVALLANTKTNEISAETLQKRVERRKEFERKKLAKRKEKRKKYQANKRAKTTDLGDNQISDMMGFGSFGSSKV